MMYYFAARISYGLRTTSDHDDPLAISTCRIGTDFKHLMSELDIFDD
jgi:hypothetical protein